MNILTVEKSDVIFGWFKIIFSFYSVIGGSFVIILDSDYRFKREVLINSTHAILTLVYTPCVRLRHAYHHPIV